MAVSVLGWRWRPEWPRRWRQPLARWLRYWSLQPQGLRRYALWVEDLARFLLHGEDVLVMQLAANVIGTDLTLHFLLDRIEAAFETTDPQPGRTRSAR